MDFLKNLYISIIYVFKRKLACVTLCNTLRPRLISGQLRLAEAQTTHDTALGGLLQA